MKQSDDDWPKPKPRQTGNETRAEPGIHKKTTTANATCQLPVKFQPRFWRDADARIHVVKVIRKRLEVLRQHCGGNESIQRDLLCQRLAFISIILESKEVVAAEGGNLDLGSYVQACNGLVGLLKILGLEKRIKNVTDLKTLLAEEEAK